ncbi:MAG TPA: UDP-glucose 4-epimerase GalE [Caulobacteraceae bacterium]|nr:UDP-glucose 4-epimerase GalE [Caulobacteraceae bacterium]
MTTILVTCGAGYVGAHACARLAAAGLKPVVFDSLVNGHADFVQWGPLVAGDIRDRAALAAAFAAHRPVGVMHFAGLIEVGISVRDPGPFYDVNVGGALAVIEAARAAGVDAFVFSSTCATYGAPQTALLAEDHPQAPLNPYGRSKLMVERALADLEAASGFRSIALRYFNAAGADPDGRIGERHDPETHAIPLAIRSAMRPGQGFTIFGDDYPTADGTAVRDYVHVADLAEAHLLALERLLEGGGGGAYNLGGGVGTSVLELIDAVGARAGHPLQPACGARREGDAAVLVADARKAARELGWRPKLGLPEIIETAWRWHEREG